MAIARFDPFVPGFIQDPYPFYHQYRTEDPVHLGVRPMPEYPESWYIFRRADVAAVLKNPHFIHDRRCVLSPQQFAPMPRAHRPFWDSIGNWMLLSDPPNHTRLRGLVSKAFSQAAIRELRSSIEDTAERILDQVQSQGHMDVVRDYAFPLPLEVISRVLGIPIEDHAWFRHHSKIIAAALDLRTSADVHDDATTAIVELTHYVRDIITARRKSPRNDLVSALIGAQTRDNRLSEEELVALCILLLFAGQETTADFIGNAALALLTHPDQRDGLQKDPALTANAVEELLRFDSPVQISTFRIATHDVRVGDKIIRRGENAAVVLGAVNRDPQSFPDPDRLNIRRNLSMQTLVFGQGIHYCLGAHLARLEGQIAVSTLLRRIPTMQLHTEGITRRSNISFRGLTALPVSF